MYTILYLSGVKAILYVALGGAIGALLRYFAGVWLKPDYHAAFPFHTFLINTTGCFLIGIVFACIVTFGSSAGLQLFVITGILGGFTTFSSYSMETVYLMQQGEVLRGLMYVLLSNLVGIGSAWLGYGIVKTVI